jgi:hypothetical protein
VLNPAAGKQLPKMDAWRQAFEDRENIKQYLSSDRRPEMINGTEAGRKAVV